MLNFDDEDDELNLDDEPGGMPPARGPASMDAPAPVQDSSAAAPPLSPPAPLDPSVKQYLAKKFDLGPYTQQAREQLVKDSAPTLGDHGLAALAAIGAGLGGRDPNAAANETLKRQSDLAQQGISNFDKAREQKISDYKATQDNEKFDPSSESSMAFRKIIESKFPDVARAYGDSWKGVSAADQDNIFKPLQLKEQIEGRKQTAGIMAGQRADARQAKLDKDHEDYVRHVEDTAHAFRSDPASLRNDAQMAAAASGKAMIDRYRGREDEMPIQDVHALVSDRLKAITGATPTEQEIKAQMPHSLSSRWADLKSGITGSPEPAGVGDFVKNIDQSFAEMEKTALRGLKNRQESVTNSPRLTAEEKQRIATMGIPRPVYGGDEKTAGGKVKVMAPDGKVKLINQEDLQAAISSGGRLVDGPMVGGR